jgi:hypothetical protein
MRARLANGLVMGVLLAVSSTSAKQSFPAVSVPEVHQITIGVYDYAQAGSGVLLKAERVTSGILQNASVSVVWLACSADEKAPSNPGCANLVGPLKIELRIVPNTMAGRLRQMSDVFGMAAQGGEGELGCDAWVFYDQVKEAAAKTGLSLPQIFGTVIAHELGHLLLGANSHSRTGLMRARWARQELLAADLGQLSFSNSERDRIRRSMVARREAL